MMMDNKKWESLEGRHFDVGICGVWYGANYGSVATYYALYRVLRKMGYSVLMIDKPRMSEKDAETSRTLHSRVFAESHYEAIGPSLTLEEMAQYNDHCDSFLMGCDQVWNYGVARGMGRTHYFDFVAEEKKKLSYASSFGHGTSFTPKDQLSDIAKLLHRFDAVSVREESAVEVLRKEFDVESTQVLDPVFLLDPQEYDEIIREKEMPSVEEKFMLSYILDPTPEIRDSVKAAAEKKGLKLVNLLDGRADFQKNREVMDLPNTFVAENVSEWLWYFRNSEFVITDSCHGTSFALLFEKNFISIGNRRRGMSRFESLMDLADTRDRFVLEAEQIPQDRLLRDAVDHEKIRKIFAMERERSLRWLREAMELEKETLPTVRCVPKKECCGCGACRNSCPVEAISMVEDEEGFLYPEVDEEKCIRCGRCRKACPSLHPRYDRRTEPVVYAAYGDREHQLSGSSGGMFELLARKILSEQGIVCGAAFDEEQHLCQRVIDAEQDLQPLLKSKYVQSDTKTTYREVLQALKEGRKVLYAGCGCQIAGLRSFLGREYENLYVLDLLCHGGPSPKTLRKYLEEVHAGREIREICFRDKEYFGWTAHMTVRYRDGEDYHMDRSKDLYYRAFLPVLSVRPHCQVCNYARLPRQGDLTLGDFWGAEKYDPSFTEQNGISIVSVNSGKGEELLELLKPELVFLREIRRDHVLTHGQPYGNPYKTNARRTAFHRMLQDCSLEKTLEACDRNRFDIGYLGLGADSCGEILADYAMFRFLSRENYSVLGVNRPREEENVYSPLKYRNRQFEADHYPVVSVQKYRKGLPALNRVCRSFFLRKPYEGMSTAFIEDRDRLFVYRGDGKEPVIPEVFLTGRELPETLERAPKGLKGPFAVWYAGEEHASAKARAEKEAAEAGWILFDITGDLPVEEWLYAVLHGEKLYTDRQDVLGTAALFRKTVELLDPGLESFWEMCMRIEEPEIERERERIRKELKAMESAEKHYDVGVLGVWYGSNYGSVATYYSLYSAIRSLGKSVLMVHRPYIGEFDERSMENRDSLKFARAHYDVSPAYSVEEIHKLNEVCDGFVLGSDQLWNYGVTKIFGHAYFLDFAAEDRLKIAYATSFGGDHFYAPWKYGFRALKCMRRMNYVSVREADGVTLCGKLFGIRAKHTLDPVLLCDSSCLGAVADESKRPKKKNYIAAYILDPTPEKREALLYLSKLLGKDLVIMLDGWSNLFQKNKKAMDLDAYVVSGVTESDWLFYIKHSDFVVTDSFHGTCMALLFEKQFCAIANYKRGISRFESLLGEYGLSERLLRKASRVAMKDWTKQIDYGAVNARLNAQREESMEWLREAVCEGSPQQSQVIRKEKLYRLRMAYSCLVYKFGWISGIRSKLKKLLRR